MPKLIIKQDLTERDLHVRRSKWLSVSGLLVLLVMVATATLYLTRPAATSPAQRSLSLESATGGESKTQYLSMHNVFDELGAEYELLSQRGADDYEKNLKLLGKSEGILRHLEKMQAILPEMGLDAEEYRQLLNRQQFYKDYWQAKSHFRQLRVSRFEGGDNNSTGSVTTALKQKASMPAQADTPVGEEVARKFRLAAPPPGVELPMDFCDLSNREACKPPPTDDVASTITAPLVEDLSISAPESGALPKKFKFAKPPAGMELPGGLCDLSNPGACNSDGAKSGLDTTPLTGEAPGVLPGNTTQVKKFEFAKPPAGMELPKGFCDLSNPESCKPGTAEVGMASE